MRRLLGLILLLAVTACLSPPGRKVVSDGAVDPGYEEGVEEAGDLFEEPDAGHLEEEGTHPDEGTMDPWEGSIEDDGIEIGPITDLPDGAADDGVVEAWDVLDGWVCHHDEDCTGMVGVLGPCEVAVCADGQCRKTWAKKGTPCMGDGNPCTVDECTEDGLCVHEPIQCLDPPENACEGSTLVTYSLPGWCDSGKCEYHKTERICEQGCTVSDGVAHCVGENPCAGVTCDEAPFPCLKVPGTCVNGSCIFEFDDGGPCDDGDACSTDDRCWKGVCVGLLVKCEDPPKPSCRDAKTLLTYSWPGTCVAGECSYPTNEVFCEGGCEVGRDGVAACVGQDPCAGLNCEKSNSPCLKEPGICVGGQCVFLYNDGASCEDGNPCTQGDVCGGGKCLPGTPKNCEDGNPCTDNSCDAESGQCKSSFNELPCNDGKACTTGDRCSLGSCVGMAKVCDAPPAPTCEDFHHAKVYEPTGTCTEPSGQCVYSYTITPCRSGWCQYGYCTGEGMTLVGYFEAGGGEVTGSGYVLRGTLGAWFEGAPCSCQNCSFTLHAGW